jgi:hypothetical protein
VVKSLNAVAFVELPQCREQFACSGNEMLIGFGRRHEQVCNI